MRSAAEDLAGFREALTEVRREGTAMLDGLDAGQLGWRPRPEAWSIGQVAAHLRTTNEAYLPRMRQAIERGRARPPSRPAPYRPTLMGGWLVRAMGAERKLPAPRAFQPTTAGGDWAAEVEGYRATLERLAELLEAAEGVSLSNRLSSPVSRIIRMNLGDAFALWLAHDRRHLGQIRRVREHPAFPAHSGAAGLASP